MYLKNDIYVSEFDMAFQKLYIFFIFSGDLKRINDEVVSILYYCNGPKPPLKFLFLYITVINIIFSIFCTISFKIFWYVFFHSTN